MFSIQRSQGPVSVNSLTRIPSQPSSELPSRLTFENLQVPYLSIFEGLPSILVRLKDPTQTTDPDPDSWRCFIIRSPRFIRRRGPKTRNPFTPPTQVEGLEGEWRINRAIESRHCASQRQRPTLSFVTIIPSNSSLTDRRHTNSIFIPGTTDQETKNIKNGSR